jgi:TP901 family phage tail tape measure protein
MAEKVGLIAVLDIDQFTKNYKSYESALRSMNSTTGNVANSLSQSFLGFGDSLWKVAAILSGAVVAGALAAGVALSKMAVAGIKDAANLEMQLSNIAAVLNLTNDEAGFLKDVIIDLGLDPTLKVTTFEAAQAMELLAKNGIFAGMSVEQMKVAAAEAGQAVVFLANATGADFGQAANIATSAMTLFGLETSDLVGIISNITAVTTNSKFTIHDYELALRNGGAASAAFGVSLEDFNTVVAATADELGTGMRDGTSFANMLYRLTPNSQKAEDAMRELGLVTADGRNIFFDTEGNLKGVNEIASILHDTFMGTSKIMVEVGGRTAAQNKLLGEMRTEYQDAQTTIEEYTTGVKGMLASEDEKNKALEEAQRVLDTLGPQIANLESIQGSFTESTKQLTAEQRLVAIETIFGRDALGAVLGLMKEGAPIVDDVARVMDALAVSEEEAFALVSSGITEFELLEKQMARTDAVENAKTRMDNLRGSMEILGGIVEAIKIKFGDEFLPVLDKIVKAMSAWLTNSQPLQDQLFNIADAVSGLIDALFEGEDPLTAFSDMLTQIGGTELSDKFTELYTSVSNFVTPIINFVEQHSEAFISALEGIGVALAAMMIASAVATAFGILFSWVTLFIGIAAGLGYIWGENLFGIQEKVLSLKESFAEFLENVTGVKDFKITGLDSIGTVLQGTFESIPGWIESIDWQGLYDGFIAGVGRLGEGLGTILNEIDWAVVAETVITALGNAMILGATLLVGAAKVIVDTLVAFMTGFITTTDWGQLVSEIGAGIVAGLENIDTSLQPFKDKLSELQSFISGLTFDDFIEGIATIGYKLSGGKGGLDAYLDSVKKIETVLEPIRAFFAAFTNTILPPLKDAWGSLGDTIENNVAPIWGTLKETIQSLMPILEFIATGIGTFIENVGYGLAIIGTFITALITGIIDGFARAVNLTVSGVGWLIDGVLRIVGGIADVLVGLWDVIAGIFTGNLDRIKEGFSKIGNGILDIITGLFEGIAGIIVGGIGSILAFIYGFVEGVIGFFVRLYDELVGHSIIPDMINGIIDWFLELITAVPRLIITMVTEVLALIVTFVTDMLAKAVLLKNLVVAKVKELWDEFITLVKDKTLEILEKVGTFILDMIAKFTKAKDDFFTAGANIIDGLIEGIQSKLAAAISVIKGFGEDIKAAWDDFWETHSPSKLMMESGENIMTGVQMGIETKVSPLDNTMKNAAGDIFGSFLNRTNDIIPTSAFSNPVQNVETRTNNIQLNNNFAGSPQITDANQLEMMLAGYV